MGHNETKVELKQGWHQKFGKIQFIKSNTQPAEVYILANITYEAFYGQHQKWQKMLKQLQKNLEISPHLILPLKIQSQRCLLCTNIQQQYSFKLYYRRFKNTLHEDIKHRRDISCYYLQRQLWYFMFVMIKAAAYFQQQSSHLGNVHANNVFIDQNGKVRIFTVFSSPQQVENFQKIKASKYQDALIAPEQIERIAQQETQGSELNKNKIDLFNMGLVLLCAIILKDSYFIYNRNKFSINFDKLETYKGYLMNESSQRYKKALKNLVYSFLIYDPNLRKTPTYFFNLLKRYQKQIINFQQFNTDSLLIDEKSPQVLNYIHNISPNSRPGKYLSLSKDWDSNKKQSKHSKQTNGSNEKQQDYHPSKLQRKLFTNSE